jgi:hypothetical protein
MELSVKKTKFPKVPSGSPQLCVQRHMGSGGGLFTRSGSAAHPLFAERLSAIANLRIDEEFTTTVAESCQMKSPF